MTVTARGERGWASTSPETVADRYELPDPPLRGSMGEVYRAYDLALDREVAVKLIRADLADGDQRTELVRRFRREARLLARMRHPGTPAVFDTGEDRGRPYLVMEYVHGATLRNLVDEVQPVPLDWAVYITAQLCAVLARAHELSLVHRDLRPDNVLLTEDGTIKVVDFGLAILTDSSSTHLTPPGVVTGDWRYRAPERDLGLVSPRTDLYAVGRILEEMLEHPSDHDDLRALADELTSERPQDRPRDAAEVCSRLAPLLRRPSPLPGFVADTAPRGYVEIASTLSGGARRDHRSGPVDLTPTALRRARTAAAEHAEHDRPGRAAEILQEIVDHADTTDPALTDILRDLANLLVDAGETGAALIACRSALDAMTRRLPADHPAVLSMRLQLASALAGAGDLAAAADRYAEVALDPDCGSPVRSERVSAARELAILRAGSGDRDTAETALVRLLDQLRAAEFSDQEQIIATVDALMLVRAPVRPASAVPLSRPGQ